MGKSLLKFIISILYRLDVRLDSLERILSDRAGERVILSPHYSSYLDPILFYLFAPGSPLLVLTPSVVRQKWFSLFAGSLRYVEIDFSDPFALKRIDELWTENNYLIIFPEYEPTTDGQLMKMSDVAITTAERSGAWIVPARACNMQFTPFSRMGERLPRLKAPKVTLISGEPEKIVVDGAEFGERRRKASLKLDRMMRTVMMCGIWDKKPIFDTLLEQRKLWGKDHVMGIDADGTETDWDGFITKIFALRAVISRIASSERRVGIMMPNSTATLALIVAMQQSGKVPAMINFSIGARTIIASCAIANVKKIITSSKFVEAGNFTPLVDTLKDAGIEVVFLERAVSKLSAFDKIACLMASKLATPARDGESAAEDVAVLLFTSGSEGAPKAVPLTHLNIQANTAQVRSALPFYRGDVMLNVMPMFHSFGLCTGAFLPLSCGMAVAFYPTPLHFKKIPHFSYVTKATVVLGTNAFLLNYAKNGSTSDFVEMRFVVCGGDKLKEGTAKLWQEKYGIRVVEGYGVTEASPVVAANSPGYLRMGSVGRMLAGIEWHIKPVPGVEEGVGRLVVKGPNIMGGYLMADGTVSRLDDDGYDTGDIVRIDDDGFVHIQGRAKRFAKIGGEMLSLAQIEEVIQEIWQDNMHALTTVPDESRGEVLVLLTERQSPDRDELRRGMAHHGLPELALPKRIIHVESIPKIGVGKVDYQRVSETALSSVASMS